jgi:hypothetical protein
MNVRYRWLRAPANNFVHFTRGSLSPSGPFLLAATARMPARAPCRVIDRPLPSSLGVSSIRSISLRRISAASALPSWSPRNARRVGDYRRCPSPSRGPELGWALRPSATESAPTEATRTPGAQTNGRGHQHSQLEPGCSQQLLELLPVRSRPRNVKTSMLMSMNLDKCGPRSFGTTCSTTSNPPARGHRLPAVS